MKPQDISDEIILERHEKNRYDYKMEKIRYKEMVFQEWVKIKERIRDILEAKKKRKIARVLARTLSGILPILEKKEEERRLREVIKLEAKIKGHNKELKKSEIGDEIDEEMLYMTVLAIGMRMKLSNGKGRRELNDTREKLLKKAKEKGWSSDIKEMEYLILSIPEERRRKIEKQLTRAIHRR